tara:strand:+ start:17332 stop:20343 length:3012 start_codon:yes stop_codon:yes gene_type:complete
MDSTKKPKKHIKKKIIFKGKNVYYYNIPGLAKKLKVSKDEARKLVSDIKKGNTDIYLIKGQNFGKVDITKKINPLLLQQFGISRLTTKNIVNKSFRNKTQILKSIPSSKQLKLLIKITFKFILSSEKFNKKKFIQRSYDVLVSGDIMDENQNEFILYDKYLEETGENFSNFKFYHNEKENKNLDSDKQDELQSKGYNVIIDKVELLSEYTNQKIKIENLKMKEKAPLNIDNLFNEVIYDNANGNCVYTYLSSIYPKFSKKKMKGLETTNDLYEYCKDNQIKMVAYNISGNIIKAYYPIKKNKSRKALIFICYNNHLYPIKNSLLNKVKTPTKLNVIIKKNLDNFLIELLDKQILPVNIKFIDAKIYSFIIDDNLYIDNEDYLICKEILEKFGVLDKLTPYTTLNNISKIFESLYLKENIDSFMPKNNKIIKGGYNYNNEKNVLSSYNLDKEYDLITIDKVKCFSYSLSQLKFLISVDVRCDKWKKYNNEKIIDNYLYVVYPKYSSILLPDNNIYCGEYIKYCESKGLEFEIQEVLETKQHTNFYTDMIVDLYNKIDNSHFKRIINIMIGKMESDREINIRQQVKKICNTQESETEEGFQIKLNKDWNLIMENKTTYNISNKKPIAIQIKDNARKMLYEKMEILNLENNDIVQIKTDSITFINKDNKYKNYISNELDGWKTEEYANITGKEYFNRDISLKYDKCQNMNQIYNCYAGCGKTHKIINEIIPNLTKSYIVLTPSHATLKTYKKKGLNSKVIQSYSLTETTPSEDIIIIDEIGMVDKKGWGTIYTSYLQGKKIYAFGDFNQLKSIDGNIYYTHNFIKSIFGYIGNMDTNYRNNFSKKYYDSLIYSTNKKYLIEEIEKVNCKLQNSDVVIAYRNITRHKYNNKLLKLKGFKCKVNDKNGCIEGKLEQGLKIICMTNDLRKKEIYNKFTFTIIKIDKDKYHLDNDLILTYDEIIKNFHIGYCRTLYSIQGESIENIYYTPEDYFFIDGRTAYTFISRLKI